MTEKFKFLRAQGDFHFQFYIEKAIPLVDDDGLLIVEGVASTVNIDHDNERMAGDALESMAQQINTSGVPLRIEHDKNDRAIVGEVYKAWVDERNQLWIRAAIDPKHPAGPMLHESLRQGAKFGLSVGGRVKNAIRELSEATGRMVKTFYDVSLDEVSVTKRPANYDAWLFAKSYKEKDQDVEPFYSSPLFREFLSQNPHLDYEYQFAKSIPDKAWREVKDNKLIIDKNMKNEEDKKEKGEVKDEEVKDKSEEKDEEREKSFVTKAEFSKFSSEVTKGIAAIGKMFKAMSDSPKDATNPDKSKEKEVGDEATKAREGQEDEGSNGGEEKKEGVESAMDSNNPDKKKEENVGDTAKSEEKDEEKEKSSEDDKDEMKDKSDKEDEGDEKEKSEDDKDEKEKAEKEPKNLEEAVKSIETMTKRMFGSKEVAKSEVRKSEGNASIDLFAASVSKALMGMEERFEKSGTTVPGLARMLSDMIQNDPEVQKSISAMLKEPGLKKSVAMGVPYIVSKDGKRFALRGDEIKDSTVEKSTEGKSFKEVYKSEFSAFGESERGQ